MRRRQLIGGVIFVIWGAAIAIKGLVNGVPDRAPVPTLRVDRLPFGLRTIGVGARALIKNAS